MNLRGYVKFSGCVASLPARNHPEINNFHRTKIKEASPTDNLHILFSEITSIYINVESQEEVYKHPSKIEQTLKKETCHSYRKWSLNTVNFRSVIFLPVMHRWCWTIPTEPNYHPDLRRGLGAGGAEAISTCNWTYITRCFKVYVLVHPSSLASNIFWTLKWTWH